MLWVGAWQQPRTGWEDHTRFVVVDDVKLEEKRGHGSASSSSSSKRTDAATPTPSTPSTPTSPASRSRSHARSLSSEQPARATADGAASEHLTRAQTASVSNRAPTSQQHSPRVRDEGHRSARSGSGSGSTSASGSTSGSASGSSSGDSSQHKQQRKSRQKQAKKGTVGIGRSQRHQQAEAVGNQSDAALDVPFCHLCCATGHTALVTHLNGDKEPTCFVVFKYEWGEFATSEVVSDETGAALPTAWVNWYAPYPSCL